VNKDFQKEHNAEGQTIMQNSGVNRG